MQRYGKNRDFSVPLHPYFPAKLRPGAQQKFMYTIDHFSEIIEQAIAAIDYPRRPDGLYAPIRYTLEGGGKRLRPVLLMAAAQGFGTSAREVVNQALGIEMFHNFTLLHDDVMDNAFVRRGRPTVHRRWNNSTAILSGDAMLTMATQFMAQCDASKLPAVMQLFNRTAMEIYEGQQYDMDFEERTDVTVEEYMEMIRLKTSVLLACACRLGALLAGASTESCEAIYSYGERLGLAFQLQDDYLDTYGDPALFGKEIGGDIINEKKTWLWINAMAEAPERMKDVLSRNLTDYLKIEEVKAIYDSLDLPARSHELIERYAAEAVEALDRSGLPSEAREFFRALAEKSVSRSH